MYGDYTFVINELKRRRMINSSNGIVSTDAAVNWLSLSIKSLDTKPSSRYPIILKVAKDRALRAIKRNRNGKN